MKDTIFSHFEVIVEKRKTKQKNTGYAFLKEKVMNKDLPYQDKNTFAEKTIEKNMNFYKGGRLKNLGGMLGKGDAFEKSKPHDHLEAHESDPYVTGPKPPMHSARDIEVSPLLIDDDGSPRKKVFS